MSGLDTRFESIDDRMETLRQEVSHINSEELDELKEKMSTAIGEAVLVRIEMERLEKSLAERFDLVALARDRRRDAARRRDCGCQQRGAAGAVGGARAGGHRDRPDQLRHPFRVPTNRTGANGRTARPADAGRLRTRTRKD